MKHRVGVVVAGDLVGTVPAFENGIGDFLKSPFYTAHKARIWAETRHGEVILLRAVSREIAGRIPEFESSSEKPARSLHQVLVSLFRIPGRDH